MERGRFVLTFGEPCAGVHGFWRRRETSLGPGRYKAAGVFVLVSPVRERRGGWRRRETEEGGRRPWRLTGGRKPHQKKTSPPCPLSIHGEGVICFGIGRGVLWWDLIFVCASGPGAAAPGWPGERFRRRCLRSSGFHGLISGMWSPFKMSGNRDSWAVLRQKIAEGERCYPFSNAFFLFQSALLFSCHPLTTGFERSSGSGS